MNAKPIPPIDYLLQCFSYQDGALYWLKRPQEHFRSQRAFNMWNARFSGKRAGKQSSGGHQYRQIGIDGLLYLEHRIIAAMHGICTGEVVDHIDGDVFNNRPENLRAATQAENCKNRIGWRKKDSPNGVHKKPNGRWVAYVRANNKHKHLGTFATMAEALAVRKQAEQTHYGEFAAARGVELEEVAA